jgi:heme exporter protein C
MRVFYPLLSPKKFIHFSSQLLPWLQALFVILLPYGLIEGLWLSPSDAVQGEGYRILYVHVPCAFLSLFVYSVMALAAAGGIIFRLKLAFLVMRESASIGALFAFLALCTGSIWGKPMWGTWWMWDARLTSEFILLLLYLGILFFQSATHTHKRAQEKTALLVLIGFVDIPIIHYSVSWWNTLHQGPTLNLFGKSLIDSSMLYPLLAMITAALLYYAIVLLLRMRSVLIAPQKDIP